MGLIGIDSIVQQIKERGLFQGITRYPYMPYDMRYALQVVEAIGKNRNPNFIIDDENRFIYENLIRWVHADPKMQSIDPQTRKVVPGRLNAGIYIAGSTGSGKSWVLEIMSAYTLIDNVQVKTGNQERCLFWGNTRTDAICDEYTELGTFDRFKRMSILGLQDLGTDAEPTESVYMGNRLSVVKQLLEHRGDRADQITLVTSNLPMNHQRLIDRYGDRVSSRLNEMCNYFELKGKDRRKSL